MAPNLENYTNKAFLVSEHETWIYRLQTSVTVAWDTGIEGCTERSRCKVVEIIASNRVNISELKRSINQILYGKFFLCRNITPPYKTVSLETVVEDPEGDNAVRLALYNYTECNMAQDLTRVIPIGSLLVIKDPFFQTAGADGGYTLRVDSPAHVLFMEEQVFQTIFPDLTWKGSIPKQYRKSIEKIPSIEESKVEKSEGAPRKSNKKVNDGRFNAGDIIQGKRDYFVQVLSDQYKGKRCDNCFEDGKVFRCTQCLLMFYCNKTCQTKDWKDGHSIECKSEFFKKTALPNALPSNDFNRQLFRLFAKLKLKPECGKDKCRLYDGTDRSFDDLLLLSRQSELKNDVGLTKLCEEMAKELEQEQLFMDNDEGIDHLLRLAVVWRTNALSILDKAEAATVGSAIFIESSVFEHSCKPNAFFNFQGSKLQIRAISSISKGTKPCVSYLEGNESKEKRAALLMERCKLICTCERCILEENENLVDYDKLKSLIEDAEKQSDWKTYLDAHHEILLLLRKLYQEYDQRISNRCFLGYQEAKKLAAPSKITRSLAKTAKEHLMITFGAESSEYQKCVKLGSG